MMRVRSFLQLALAAALATSTGRADADGEAPEAAENEPHGHAHGGGGDMSLPPEDAASDDPSLPAGTLEIHVVDPMERPLPKAAVTLGIVYNSVQKGESRKRVSVTADDRGIARVEHLESGSGVAYRPMVQTDGATFSAMPFRMPERTGMKAVLHVYPVVTNIEDALVVAQSLVQVEVKDDRIQVEQAFKIYNFGKTAWVPHDLVVSLPEAFTAFSAQQGMSDVGVDAVPKKGVRIRGTFNPGQHVVDFSWQLPYAGEREVAFEVGMTPRMAAARVIAPASKDMKLEVPGFPPPQAISNARGQRDLITEKQLRKDEPPLKTLSISIGGLPSEGYGKHLATGLAGVALLLGLAVATRNAQRGDDHEAARARHLAELEDLEHARRRGEVGPQTYEKERRRLLDALALTFAATSAYGPAPSRSAPRRRASSV